ncbi:MAG: putative porin, partial [Verrucomicrobiota bacterium]
PNPFVTTPMVWDADINPEGFAEQVKYRDGNNEFSANFGQFIYSTGGTQNAFGAAPNSNDIFMLGWQAGYKRYVDGTTTFFQVNPTLYSYANLDRVNNPVAFNGVFSAAKQTAINDLLVFELPAEYDWLIGGTPVRVFGDYAVNFAGDDRARKFAGAVKSGESTAYTLGAQYGKAANRGEWDVRAFWQSVGAFALDPNLVDSDLFDSRVNMQGLVFNVNYALGAATQLTLTYGDGRRKNQSLIAPGAGDIATVNTTLANTLQRLRVLQLDLNIKF